MSSIIEFTISENQDYIELNKLLKIAGLVGTGGEANVRILEGEVQVNHMIASEKRKKIRHKDIVEIDGITIHVK